MSKTLALILAAAVAIAAVLTYRSIKQPQTASESSLSIISTPESQKTPDTHFEQWHEFISPTKTFKVLVPTLPQHATEKLSDPKTKQPRQYDMYVSESDNGTLFMISIITIMDKNLAKIDEQLLSTVMNDMLKSTPQGKLKTMQIGQYKQYPSIDFSIENSQVNIDGKVFLVNSTLYALTSVAKLNNYTKQEFDFFVNSFELTSPEKAAPVVIPKKNGTPVPQTSEKK